MALALSQITDRLFVGNTPGPGDYARLRALGVGLVINMRYEQGPAPDLHQPPMPVLWLRTIDSPIFPLPMKVLFRGVEAALGTLAQGQGVYTHCAHGVHRGPAMASCILVAQGYTPRQAVALVRQARPVSNPGVWYIRWRIEHFAAAWRALAQG
jgi:hypothetical protein